MRSVCSVQAWGVSIGKLVFWHWSQPVAYFYVLVCFYCTLDPWQRIFGCIVAAREAIYLISTILAFKICRVYLLLELSFEVKWETVSTWIIYLFAPHNYVALCIARALRTTGARQFVYDVDANGQRLTTGKEACTRSFLCCLLFLVNRQFTPPTVSVQVILKTKSGIILASRTPGGSCALWGGRNFSQTVQVWSRYSCCSEMRIPRSTARLQLGTYLRQGRSSSPRRR